MKPHKVLIRVVINVARVLVALPVLAYEKRTHQTKTHRSPASLSPIQSGEKNE